ncbi:hypothetical protein [Azospirillum thermophilum]|uniref:Uncharacterized protein n=1 Tax=Azospirillum thermophilum TaxID=2202148 RepID=A0A2S2CLE4_9PROT|nr:hypothetical protein [Azospirillum thermophilum]AWK85190.1 hypothetical protein DEW08_02430 [Azospirillum thermophilum]
MTVHSLDEDASTPALAPDSLASAGGLVKPCGRPPRGVAGAVLFLGDLLVLAAAVFLAVLFRMQLRWLLPIEISPESFVGVAVSATFLPLVFAAAGLYPGYGQGTVERLRKRVIVTALWFGMMILFDRLAQDGQWSRGILLAAAVISLIALPLWDAAARGILIRRGWWGEPVVVLGSAKRRAMLVKALAGLPDLGWVPVAEGEIPGQDGPEHGKPLAAGVAVAVVVPEGGLGVSSLADHLPYRRVVLVPRWTPCRACGSRCAISGPTSGWRCSATC